MKFDEFLERYQRVEVEEHPNSVPVDPLVSICVQTYQHAPFIRECLDGILMQDTDHSFEVLIGEDQSTDGTREICIEYARRYPDKIRLFLHHRDNNIRISGRPTGRFPHTYNLLSSKGKYLAICDGDDAWTDPKKLEKQVAVLEEQKGTALCYHAFKTIDEKGEDLETTHLRNTRDFLPEDLARGAHMHPSTILFRNVFSDVPESIFNVINADTFLIGLMSAHGSGKYCKDIDPSRRRIHKGGLWTANDKYVNLRHRENTFENLKSSIDPRFRSAVEDTIFNIKIYTLLNRLSDRQFFRFAAGGLRVLFKNPFRSVRSLGKLKRLPQSIQMISGRRPAARSRETAGSSGLDA
ncbi:MAG: glycosyltransferase [Acidobacteria bacterium]|nr:MAG: glycosyltransferase [Acidobacteriota bacterium]REJ99079.1 MAG: glycosyltransferase [Acidobacteriota bacterium]REK16201.1 MAG: glycosyltransferase [Acidobacteriota bacterium]REK43882.1 MAG: glycosyltransferase [Acidobacteriota bacterium]